MTASSPPASGAPERLPKELGLFDVYAISTGAMFSSGFFLLPGLAAAQTGPSVPLAYLVAGVFILPAMFSVAELATAMPRAGGAYYFLDRSLGPMVGTVGGLGTWLALILKSAFALVGMGAYLRIYFDVPIEPLAVGLTFAFMTINIVGAKETSGLQRILVTALVGILAFFLAQGLAEVFSLGVNRINRERFSPFLPFGFAGFMSTVGFVFVSYAGLTKVASVSEEIRDPDRNIPLGMGLSLATATFVYSVGVYIIVAVLPPDALRDDLTPVATAAEAFFDWLPGGLGVGLIVIAAIAAFASTGNAGILSASRYPLAMARDRLMPDRFATLGRFRTPTFAIVVTALLMAATILLLDVANIAKLASAFQLLLFSLLSLAVVIMRESGIEGYDPGYRSPLYPWMQIFGFLSPLWLIAEMGELAMLFTMGLVAVTIGWYFHYAQDRVERTGAIFHAFARLGTLRHTGLDQELRSIVREKGLRDEDPWERVIARAQVIECQDPIEMPALARLAAEHLAPRVGAQVDILTTGLLSGMEAGYMPVSQGAALPHVRLEGIPGPVMLLVRVHGGLQAWPQTHAVLRRELSAVRAVLFLVSPEDDAGLHLRLLGHVATRVDDASFLGHWMAAQGPSELRESLLREERFLTLEVGVSAVTSTWPGKPIRALELPPGSLVALVRREGHGIIPRGDTVLRAGDHLTIIGEPRVIRSLDSGGPKRGSAPRAQPPDQP